MSKFYFSITALEDSPEDGNCWSVWVSRELNLPEIPFGFGSNEDNREFDSVAEFVLYVKKHNVVSLEIASEDVELHMSDFDSLPNTDVFIMGEEG